MGALARANEQDPPQFSEYVLKAGFLFNFAKYVEWPADAFAKPESPIIVAVVGPDPFGADLEKVLKGKTAKGRPLAIERFREAAEVARCHILFVPRSESSRLPDIMKRLAGRPTLTVGEDQAFCKAGGALNILVERERARLEANPDAAERAKLTIDTKLLRAATIVKAEK